jgi:hypothetical protein
MQLAFSLSRNKWYQSNLITPYGVWALQCDVGLNEDKMSGISMGEILTPWKVKFHIEWMSCDDVTWVSSLTLIFYKVRLHFINDSRKLQL